MKVERPENPKCFPPPVREIKGAAEQIKDDFFDKGGHNLPPATPRPETSPGATRPVLPAAEERSATFEPNKTLKAGYLVGVDQEDKFVFETFGTDKNVVS